MATAKKSSKSTKKKAVKVADMKPAKDAKGGGGPSRAGNRPRFNVN